MTSSTLHGKLTAQEEQIAEYVDKIAVMEENLKRVTELFTVQKSEMERCQIDLQVTEKELEETQKHLEITKVRLVEEEYVASNLENTEEKLHGTATKLLSTVKETTKDVSGLHAKLDRKKAVEQYNAEAQQTFTEHMNALFEEMQNSVKENYGKQQQILDSYTLSVGDLLSASSSAFEVTAATIDAAFSSVKGMVSAEVSLASEKILKQESLTSQNKNDLQKVVEEHTSGLDRALSSLSPVVKLVLNINAQLQNNVKKHASLAEKVTGYKEEMTAFFQGHSLALRKLQEDSSRMFSQLQHDYESLEKQVELAKLAQQKGTVQLIACLKDQLSLLEQETQQNLSGILEKGGRLKQNIAAAQDHVTVQTTGLATSAASQHSILTQPLDDFSQEIRQSSSENVKILLQSTSHCEDFGKSLERVSQETNNWGEAATSKMICIFDQQRAFLNSRKEHLQRLYKNLDDSCNASVTKVTDHVDRQKDAQEADLKRLLDKLLNDKKVLMKQEETLLEEAKHGLTRVNGFMRDELKVDIPTGTTPQRKDYCYPVTVVKTEPRDVLLEKLRQKQLELRATLEAVVTAEILEQDSLVDEEEIRETNESLLSENSYSNSSLCIQANGGVPFFQHKRSVKKDKENKLPIFLDKAKEEDSADTSFSKSKYPLRIQN